jgi:hypothetical protein
VSGATVGSLAMSVKQGPINLFLVTTSGEDREAKMNVGGTVFCVRRSLTDSYVLQCLEAQATINILVRY